MRPAFATAEGLRTLLNRVHAAGREGWRSDPDAAELMAFTIQKYRPLAARHGCEPEDSAVAAFEAMRTRAVRTANDPWAVVTRAVQVSLIAEERANGLLCSPTRARRASTADVHDPRRFSDTEADLADFHPALRAGPVLAYVGNDQCGPSGADSTDEDSPTSAFEAVDLAIALFVALGWPVDTATCALDYVASRLVESGSRPAAHAMLRRDHAARALLDLDRRSWASLLRLILGNPDLDQQCTSAGHGVLLRLLIGHPIAELLADDLLVLEISRTAPRTIRRRITASHA